MLGLRTSAKYEATRPVPAMERKRRRVNPRPRPMPLALLQVGHSMVLLGSLGLLMCASIEEKLERVEERPLQILGLLPEAVRAAAGLEVGDGGRSLRVGRIA
jgi:hypothetical protein